MTQETKQDNKDNKNDIKRSTKTSRELEAEIGETRSAITEDIRALSDKVSPANLKQEAKDAAKDALNSAKDTAMSKANEVKDVIVDKAIEVKDATLDRAREVTDTAVDKANEVKEVAVEKAQEAAQAVSETYDEVSYQTRRAGRAAFRFTADNAVPLGMIGIGAGWLIASARRDRARDDYRLPGSTTTYRDYPADNSEYYTSSAYADYRQPASRGGDGGGGLYKRAEHSMEDAGRNLRESAQRGTEKLRGSARRGSEALRGSAMRSKEAVQQRAMQLRDASRDLAQSNPLALAFGTLIAGIGVGLLLPTSEREDRLLEPGRQRVRSMIGQARDTAREVGGIARETAQEAASVLR